ncbi:unnamed protein product [Microthlaspi erraticum]|uniref:Uncharacterized protein n=1 Tax=Microthlaspi erraticum TaxID=1685480 RepID=A0A6D2JWI7_9BRAS|nr:unnamed protein product [Microthlaspi erraticum]
MREEFNQSIESLITLMEPEELKEKLLMKPEELKEKLLTTEITQKTPKALDLEEGQELTKKHQEAEIIRVRGMQEENVVPFKSSPTPFFLVLQGTKETTLFIISKQMKALL